MRSSMTVPGLRARAAVGFAVLALVVSVPVGPRLLPEGTSGRVADATRTPTPAASPGSAAAVAPVVLRSAVPAACLTAARRPGGSGLIAAYRTGRVSIASTRGVVRGSFAAAVPSDIEPALSWSPDGRWLATADGRLWTTRGASAGRLFDDLSGSWGWSPTADCALGVTGTLPDGFGPFDVSLGIPGRPPVPFLHGDITGWAFSPDGRALIVVAIVGTIPPVRASFWRIDLVSGTLSELSLLPADTCCVDLGGWAPGGTVLLFWAGPGASAMADGAALRGLDTTRAGRVVAYGAPSHPTVSLPSASFVASCGGRLYAVTGTGRIGRTVADKRLAVVELGHTATVLTLGASADRWPSCAPDGRSVAVVRTANGGSASSGRLVELTLGGTFVRNLGPGGRYADLQPEWAAPGILVGRSAAGGDVAQLWFVSASGVAHDTELRAEAWDWSAVTRSGRG
jgi:WD40-like Beta Propeller Repeat